jgi:hypothetical protein
VLAGLELTLAAPSDEDEPSRRRRETTASTRELGSLATSGESWEFERHQPTLTDTAWLPVRLGDAALRRRRDGHPPPLATNS